MERGSTKRAPRKTREVTLKEVENSTGTTERLPSIPDDILFEELFRYTIPPSPVKRAAVFARKGMTTVLPHLGPAILEKLKGFRARRTLEKLTEATTRVNILVSGTGSGKSHAVMLAALEDALRAAEEGEEWGGAVFIVPINSLAVNLYLDAVKYTKILTGGVASCSLYVSSLDESERRTIREGKPGLLFITPDMYIKSLAGRAKHKPLEGIEAGFNSWERRLLEPSILFFDEIDSGTGFTASCLLAVMLAVLEFNGKRDNGSFRLIIASATLPNAEKAFKPFFGKDCTIIEEPAVHGEITIRGFDSAAFEHVSRRSLTDGGSTVRKYRRWEHVIDRYVNDPACRKKKALVYIDNRDTIERLAARYHGVKDIVFCHAGRHASDNRAALERFNSGEARIMVTTSAAESGINIRGLDTILLVGMPRENRSLLQRIGRAAREWLSKGDVLLFLDTRRESHLELLDNDNLAREKLVDTLPEELVINLDNQHVVELALLFRTALNLPSLAALERTVSKTSLEWVLTALTARGAVKHAGETFHRTIFTGSALHVADIRRMDERYPLKIRGEDGTEIADGNLNSRELRQHALPGQRFYRKGVALETVEFSGYEVIAVKAGEEGKGKDGVAGAFLANNTVTTTITSVREVTREERLPLSLVEVKLLEQVERVSEEYAGNNASKTGLKMGAEIPAAGQAFFDRSIETEGVLVRAGLEKRKTAAALSELLFHWMEVLQVADRKDLECRVISAAGEERKKGRLKRQPVYHLLFHDKLAPVSASRAVYSNSWKIYSHLEEMVTACAEKPHELELYLGNDHGKWAVKVKGEGEEDADTAEKAVLLELAGMIGEMNGGGES